MWLTITVWLCGETATVIVAGEATIVIAVEADFVLSVTEVAVRAMEPVAGICDGAV